MLVLNTCGWHLFPQTNHGRDATDKLGPTLEFLLRDMAVPVERLQAYPHALGMSLEGRIRPRFEYLHAVGRRCRALKPVLSPADEPFARRVARQDVAHYDRWRVEHGYPPIV